MNMAVGDSSPIVSAPPASADTAQEAGTSPPRADAPADKPEDKPVEPPKDFQLRFPAPGPRSSSSSGFDFTAELSTYSAGNGDSVRTSVGGVARRTENSGAVTQTEQIGGVAEWQLVNLTHAPPYDRFRVGLQVGFSETSAKQSFYFESRLTANGHNGSDNGLTLGGGAQFNGGYARNVGAIDLRVQLQSTASVTRDSASGRPSGWHQTTGSAGIGLNLFDNKTQLHAELALGASTQIIGSQLPTHAFAGFKAGAAMEIFGPVQAFVEAGLYTRGERASDIGSITDGAVPLNGGPVLHGGLRMGGVPTHAPSR